MKFFIFHGTDGNAQGNWFPWLKEQLEEDGHTVIVHQFPTPQGQDLENWMSIFMKNYRRQVDRNTVFIGHSLGAAFSLNILERIDSKIHSCYLVAGFLGLLGNEKFDNLNKSFSDRQFAWDTIRKHAGNFLVINSDNDPYVPFAKGEELAQHLNTDVIVMHKAGHINGESGYTSFPFILELIERDITE